MIRAILGLAVALTLFWAAMQRASAQSGGHGDGHAQMHQWYQTLRDHRGYSCCDERDCREPRS